MGAALILAPMAAFGVVRPLESLFRQVLECARYLDHNGLLPPPGPLPRQLHRGRSSTDQRHREGRLPGVVRGASSKGLAGLSSPTEGLFHAPQDGRLPRDSSGGRGCVEGEELTIEEAMSRVAHMTQRLIQAHVLDSNALVHRLMNQIYGHDPLACRCRVLQAANRCSFCSSVAIGATPHTFKPRPRSSVVNNIIQLYISPARGNKESSYIAVSSRSRAKVMAAKRLPLSHVQSFTGWRGCVYHAASMKSALHV